MVDFSYVFLAGALAALFVVIIVRAWWRSQKRRLEREMAELDELERQNEIKRGIAGVLQKMISDRDKKRSGNGQH